MATILITGSKGQLGSEIQKISENQNKHTYHFHDVDTLDITEPEEIKNLVGKIKPGYIVNCAAFTGVDKAESEEDIAYLINATAVKNLSTVCAENNIKFLHISTDYVFDGKSYLPYKEDDIVTPDSAYGRTKLAGEQFAMENKNTMVIRTSWLYSSYGHNFVKTIIKYGTERGELNVIFDQVGTPTYAADLASAIVTIIESVEENKVNFTPGIYHFSNEGVCSWYDFAKEIVDIKNINAKINPIETFEYPLPAPRPQYSVFNKAKIKKTYNLSIPHWKDSLIKCLNLI